MKTKKIIAYLIDIVLISVLVTLLSSNKVTNPYLDDAKKANQEYSEVYETEYTKIAEDNDISVKEMKSFINTMKVPFYNLAKYSMYVSVWYILLTVLYFGIFQFIYNGQTLGKKAMRIKVVNLDDTETNVRKMIGRSMINGTSAFYGVNFISLLSVLALLLGNNKYMLYIAVLNVLSYIFEIVFIAFFLIRKDSRALDDIIFKTKVIECKN